MMVESRPLYLLLLPIQGTSSTTVTVPRRSIAKVRCIRRLHMSANRKLHSSKLFGPSEPSYTPYHMMVESRPLYLLLLPLQGTSSTTATVPRRSIAKVRCIRCLQIGSRSSRESMSVLYSFTHKQLTLFLHAVTVRHLFSSIQLLQLPPFPIRSPTYHAAIIA